MLQDQGQDHPGVLRPNVEVGCKLGRVVGHVPICGQFITCKGAGENDFFSRTKARTLSKDLLILYEQWYELVLVKLLAYFL